MRTTLDLCLGVFGTADSRKMIARLISCSAIVLFAPRIASAACTGSSPSWTSTSDKTSVAACVGAAASGDTVNVTGGGSVSWSGAVTVRRAIRLIGPGKANLTVTGGVEYDPLGGEESKPFELAGFTFSGNAGFSANAPTTSVPITGLKIHDCAFNNATVRAVTLSGLEFGVLYNSSFNNNFISVSVIGIGTPGQNYPHAFGDGNCLTVEDNTFGNGAGEFVSETGQGGRLCFRHNTITGYSCPGCEVFDIHGDQGSGGTTITSEYYHNNIDVGGSGTYRWMHHRGGQAVIINNVISRALDFNFTEYRSWGGNGLCSPYLAPGQINNTVYGNNIAGGVSQTPSFTHNDQTGSCGSTHESQYLQNGRDFRIASSGTEAARPASCTDNSTYVATDTDKVFQCHPAGTWTTFFKPYAYPHPLRGGSSVPTAPTGFRVTE